MQKYSEMFTKIENALRKESSLSRELFDSRFGEFKSLNYQNMSDEDIFWTMVSVVFYSGMRASTVSQRLPALKKYLYDFRKVKGYSQEEVNQILRDPDTIHHKRKIEACIANAKEFYNVVNKYGSFAKYLESFDELADEKTINKLRVDLAGRFQYLGERTVNHFLTDLGFNVLKPDRVICRIFSRLGLISGKNDIAQAIDIGRKIALATGYPIRYVDIIFVKYGQMGKDEHFGLEDGICLEKNPKCRKCEVRDYCKYYLAKGYWLH
jgi:DNA-3-methyladenine glycosylase I